MLPLWREDTINLHLNPADCLAKPPCRGSAEFHLEPARELGLGRCDRIHCITFSFRKNLLVDDFSVSP